jgi:lipid II:glycine glycyltransferase (peptidoglycan interpeptide bridge formation enzyme)
MTLAVREVADRDEWNRLVTGLPNPDLRQGYEWGEMRRADGWKPRRLAMFEGESGQAAVSILAKRVRSAVIPSSTRRRPLVRDCENEDLVPADVAVENIAREEGDLPPLDTSA